MPYFVYRVSQDLKKLEQLETFEKFRQAKEYCRDLRKQQDASDTTTVRLIFAETKKEAELLLGEKHKPSSPLEEWEA